MLTFLSPIFLLGAAAAAVPIVLHLLKRDPEPRIRFAAVKLLKAAPVEFTEKRSLRQLLLLALRVTAFVLLAAAFARPFLASARTASSNGTTIVALDTSYSMTAPGVFQRAKALARQAVERAGSGELVGVVTFADVPTLAARPAPDRALALAALESAGPGFGATRYRGAISAAVQAFGGRRGTLVVVTDLQESGWDAGDRAAVPSSARIEVLDVGAVQSNLAVTAVRVAGQRMTATIRNSGAQPREVRAHLDLDGRRAADAQASVGAHGSVDVAFDAKAAATTAVVSVDDPDGIAADNARYAVLEQSGRPQILVVTSTGDLERDGFYVRQGLSAESPAGRRFDVTGLMPQRISAIPPAQLSAAAAVFLLSTRGLEHRDREAIAAYVRGGGGLLIAAGPAVDGEIVADMLGDARALRMLPVGDVSPGDWSLIVDDVRHPMFRAFEANRSALGVARFRRVARIDGAGCSTIARFTSNEPAVLDCAVGEGHLVVFASDFGNQWNDFPLHASFVPFLHEAVQYLGGHRRSGSDFTVSEVPDGVAAKPGIAQLRPSTGTGAPRPVAVNVDPRESDLTRISVEDFRNILTRLKDDGVAQERVEDRQEEDRQHMWSYVLALMLVVLAVEGVLASRTA